MLRLPLVFIRWREVGWRFCLGALAVYGDFSRFDEGLNARTGELRQLSCQELVQARPYSVFCDDEHGLHAGGVVNKDGRQPEFFLD